MENNNAVKVADFTTLPGARYITDGDGSAEQFYNSFLHSKISSLDKESDENIIIDLDGTWGYASSFISELAIRIASCFESYDEAQRFIIIKTDDEPSLSDDFWQDVKQEYEKD